MGLDKKAKKRLDVLRKRLEKKNQLLSFAKKQTDDEDEIPAIEKEIEEIKAEIEQIKNG